MRYYWNDKEVSVEEYEALNLEWKKGVEAQELLEKKSGIRRSSSKKILQEKVRNSKNSRVKKLP
jgi:hypothetical protein